MLSYEGPTPWDFQVFNELRLPPLLPGVTVTGADYFEWEESTQVGEIGIPLDILDTFKVEKEDAHGEDEPGGELAG